MHPVYCFRCMTYRHLLASCLLSAGIALTVSGCSTNISSPAITPEEPPVTIAPVPISVVRYGRYTLVELSPTAAQQDLLLQVVEVSIPNTLNASVGDGLRHVLQRSGYQLCHGIEVDTLNTLPLPAAHVVGLPKGQAFALLQGGNLWKIRMPLPAPDPDEVMPTDLQQLAGYMRQRYTEAGDWWENQGIPGLQDNPLPDDLLDDFQHMVNAETTLHEMRP